MPPTALGYLVSAGRAGRRIVDKVPALSEVRRLAGEPIPVLTRFFKKKLPNIPNENVLLRGSDDYLTFLDLEQLWHDNPTMSYQGRPPDGALCRGVRLLRAPVAQRDEEKWAC